MSRIDDELEQAVKDAGASPDKASAASKSRKSGADDASAVVADAAEPQKRSWGLLAGLVALMGGILVLVFSTNEDSAVYAYSVDGLTAQASALSGRQVRVTGTLVSGTLTFREKPCEYAFNLQPSRAPAAAGISVPSAGEKASEYLKVSFPQCVVPDTFRDVKGVEVEVTAEGRLNSDGSLDASKVFAKCPSKYEMKESAQTMGKAPDHGGGAPKQEFIPPRKVENIH
jgi:cytochrome c-type biogenesis protein CcmE